MPVEPAPVLLSGGVPAHMTPESVSTSRSKGQKAADKAKKYAHEIEDESFHLWNVAKQQLLRPGVAGGLLGVGTFLSRCLHQTPR